MNLADHERRITALENRDKPHGDALEKLALIMVKVTITSDLHASKIRSKMRTPALALARRSFVEHGVKAGLTNAAIAHGLNMSREGVRLIRKQMENTK